MFLKLSSYFRHGPSEMEGVPVMHWWLSSSLSGLHTMGEEKLPCSCHSRNCNCASEPLLLAAQRTWGWFVSVCLHLYAAPVWLSMWFIQGSGHPEESIELHFVTTQLYSPPVLCCYILHLILAIICLLQCSSVLAPELNLSEASVSALL